MPIICQHCGHTVDMGTILSKRWTGKSKKYTPDELAKRTARILANRHQKPKKEIAEMELTQKQKLEYLDNPNACPYCGTEGNFEIGKTTKVAKEMRQEIRCGCHKHWIDVYTLSNMVELP